MKLLIFTLFISFTSYTTTEFSTSKTNSTNLQSRDASYIYKLHSKLFRLNEDPDYVINNILPEVYAQRDIIAPHYPVRNSGSSDPIMNLIDQWITDYPQEHKDYKTYLESYIRTYSE